MPRAPFILASASPRRVELLNAIGLPPDKTIPADIDETPLKNEQPNVYALRVACEKARRVSALHPGIVILAADTVVMCGRKIFPKAESEADARHCLKTLSGRRHRVYTAVAVIGADGKEYSRTVLTQVRFRHVKPAEIDAYIASGEWRGKAGGYAIQGLASTFIPWIGGSYGNVVGLPQVEAQQLLLRAGIARGA